MSARDDLVAAMEAFGEYDAMPRADRTGLDEATVMLTALTFLRNHAKALLALLDAEPVAWIPVSERLPEPEVMVITFCEADESVGTHEYYKGGWFNRYRMPRFPVTHWMPLPARPEASIADKLRAKGFTERESNAQEETVRGLTK